MNKHLITLLGILITLCLYSIYYILYKKYKKIYLNPNILATFTLLFLIGFSPINYQSYEAAGSIILKALGPVIVVLGVPLYKSLKVLFKNFRIILLGSLLSIWLSFFILIFLCKVFQIPEDIFISLIPRNITSALALEAGHSLNVPFIGLTMFSVTVSGITGAVLLHVFIKYFKLNHQGTIGIITGTQSHLLGTSQALELDLSTGAISMICVPITGIFTFMSLPLFEKIWPIFF